VWSEGRRVEFEAEAAGMNHNYSCWACLSVNRVQSEQIELATGGRRADHRP
jgi:hypothetical protein